MRIAVDARTVYAPTRRGIGKTLVDLYTTLAAMRAEWEFFMFHQTEHEDDPFAGIANIRRRRVDIPGDRFDFWEHLRLPLALARARPAVLHCPANTAPAVTPCPVVLTIHDVIPIEVAPHAPATVAWARRVRRASRSARKIITPSHYSRAAIIDKFGVPEEKVIVTHWGQRPVVRGTASAPAIAEVRRRLEIPDCAPYILGFGANDPRKNARGIIEAWARLLAAVKGAAVLVLVGFQKEALPHHRALAAAHIADGSYRFSGFIDEKDITSLITGATALCYPSLSEGFGVPLLEAFACGTPVIASSTTSLPEIAGDAAIFVDPADPDSIAAGISEVLRSEETRQRLRTAGTNRLRAFSWESCASATAAVLESAGRN